MTVVICPGVHDPALTDEFRFNVGLAETADVIQVPLRSPAYSPFPVVQEVQSRNSPDTCSGLVFIGFSAGVVAAIASAWLCQMRGYPIKALIALDGWGVPLVGDFPIHRLSHDWLTHLTSASLEYLGDGFYADPPIAHLELWRSPATAYGWWVNYQLVPDSQTAISSPRAISPISPLQTYTTAASHLRALLRRYSVPLS